MRRHIYRGTIQLNNVLDGVAVRQESNSIVIEVERMERERWDRLCDLTFELEQLLDGNNA
jgi:hypothetical protein